MILPDVLTVIYERLLQDRRLLLDYQLQPIVTLTNHASNIFIDDNYDPFELASKFRQFSRNVNGLKLFKIKNKMEFSTDLSSFILNKFVVAFDEVLLDWSIVKYPILDHYQAFQNFSNRCDVIIDQILNKSQSISIDDNSLNMITINLRRRTVCNNVKELICKDQHGRNIIGFDRFLKLFPMLENFEYRTISMDDKNFFSTFKDYLYSDDSKHLKIFKAHFKDSFLSDNELKSAMDYLFQVIVNIDVPTIELIFMLQCKASFLNPFTCKDFYSKFKSQDLFHFDITYKKKYAY
eukprot:403376165